MKRIRLDLAYRGTHFRGWARQPDVPSIAATLEHALFKVTRYEGLHTVVAGRTDAGVHARGQVAHFDVPEPLWARLRGRSGRSEADSLLFRVNSVLPSDIVVHRVQEAPVGFDARFSALSRTYRYRISDCLATRDPLLGEHVYWHPQQLDIDLMNRASLPLLGLHDFAAFCRPRPGSTTIRSLDSFTWDRPVTGPDAGLVLATVVSDAFCHNMVRALIGSVIDVGQGAKGLDWPLAMLSSRSRINSSPVVAAHGLALEGVSYPKDDELAARAALVRAKRSIDEDNLDL